jgi:Na+/H+ antiporter NhaC
VSKAIGAVDAVVALGLGALPPALVLPGLFLVASFVSLSIGTSMGTIAAVAPIALGVADASGLDRVLVTGAVVGGAMFGDNLSIISDTTIAATRSQGAQMRDKFRENFRIAVPAAIATAVLLATLGDSAPMPAAGDVSPWLVLPYVLVLLLALAGLDVVLVLGIGVVVAGGFGLALVPHYGAVEFAGDIYAGFESMVEITLLSILIGGLAALIKATGGLDWLAGVIARFARGHTGRRSGEFSIAALAAGSDALTANNTVAILVTGSLARDIAQRHGISPRRAASVLDIFACVVQGVLPYGAQILLAASLAAVSPLALAGSVHYCWLLALSAVAFMLWPQRGTAPASRPAAAD